MKIEKKLLVENLQNLIPILPTNATLPILSNIVLTTENKKLVLLATDLEIFIKKTTEIKTEEDEKICVRGKKFYEIIQALPEDIIKLTNDKVLKIENGKCVFKLTTSPIEEYPTTPEIKGTKIKIDAQNLKEKLNKILFAVSLEETRYALNGILFDFIGKKLNLAATDGRRLALATIKNEKDISGKFIIPQKAINNLIKIIGEEKKIEIIISEDKMIKFNCNNTEIITRLIDADYPNYLEVFPKGENSILKVNTQKLYQAIKRASIMVTQDSIALAIKLEKGKITVSKNTPDLGEEKEVIKAEYDGEERTIGFNPKYLLDNLQIIDEEIVEIEIINHEKPVVIKINSEYTYIILPMMLN